MKKNKNLALYAIVAIGLYFLWKKSKKSGGLKLPLISPSLSQEQKEASIEAKEIVSNVVEKTNFEPDYSSEKYT
jgi:hypothetical protein